MRHHHADRRGRAAVPEREPVQGGRGRLTAIAKPPPAPGLTFASGFQPSVRAPARGRRPPGPARAVQGQLMPPGSTAPSGGDEREHPDAEPRRAEARAGGERRPALTGVSPFAETAASVPTRPEPVITARRSSSGPGTFSFARAALAVNVDRAPAVVGRDRVVRIGDRHEVRNRLRARPDVGHRGGAAAGGREEVRVSDLAVVGDDLAGGGVDRLVRRVLFLGDPAIDLAANVRVDVELARCARGRERVRARGDGLRLQRLGGQRCGISEGTTP